LPGAVIVRYQPGLQKHGLGNRLMQQLQEHTNGRIPLANTTTAARLLYQKLQFTQADT
jgi:hypothetical protein